MNSGDVSQQKVKMNITIFTIYTGICNYWCEAFFVKWLIDCYKEEGQRQCVVLFHAYVNALSLLPVIEC